MREALLISIALAVLPARALAEPAGAPVAMAETLFQEGKQLLERGEAHAACPKLAESLRLDRATGTLLALAMCHEVEGRLASAWGEYLEVVARAKTDGRPDREEAARQWAHKLEARLSTLSIAIPAAVAEIPGLRVQRDGVSVEAPSWSTAVPVDPGPHVVTAAAPGRETWTTTVVVAGVAEHQTVTVPLLAADDRGGGAAVSMLSAGVLSDSAPLRRRPSSGATVAFAGGVVAGAASPAVAVEAAADLGARWGAALRGAWALSQREEQIDGGGAVRLDTVLLRACGFRRFRPHRRFSVQVGPELLFQIDRAQASGLAAAGSAWRSGWGVGANAGLDVPLASWVTLSAMASVDVAPSGWTGRLDVENRGEVLRPGAVRLLVALGPRFPLDW